MGCCQPFRGEGLGVVLSLYGDVVFAAGRFVLGFALLFILEFYNF